jgi:hypothetical protein
MIKNLNSFRCFDEYAYSLHTFQDTWTLHRKSDWYSYNLYFLFYFYCKINSFKGILISSPFFILVNGGYLSRLKLRFQKVYTVKVLFFKFRYTSLVACISLCRQSSHSLVV